MIGDHVAREQRQIGILLQRDPEADDPGPDGLYRVGTVANIVRYITGADDTHHLVCQGVQRMRVLDYLPGTPFLAARVLQIPEPTTTSPEIEARFLNLQRQALEAAQLLPQTPPELIAALQGTTSPATLADLATRREVEVRRGAVPDELRGRSPAVTHAPVPGFRRHAAAVRPARTHPWPWLWRPHAGPVTSYSAWRKKIR